MNETILLLICTAGVLILVVVIIVFANYMDNRWKRKQGERMRKDIENGTYDPQKKYFGNLETTFTI